VKEKVSRRKIVTVASLVVCVILVYAFYSWPPASGPIDTSWIATVEQLLEEAKPYPPNNSSLSHPANPEMLNVYLNQNGSEQLIYFGNGSALSNYLYELKESVNLQKDSTVSEYYLGEVMAANKVVSIHFNKAWAKQNYPSLRFYDAYFVLENNSNENLSGAIFVRNAHVNIGHLSLWFKTT
jgi:hypothetical protein